jgi:hypothetical protein
MGRAVAVGAGMMVDVGKTGVVVNGVGGLIGFETDGGVHEASKITIRKAAHVRFIGSLIFYLRNSKRT